MSSSCGCTAVMTPDYVVMYATVWVLCRICRPREEPLSAGRVEFTPAATAKQKGIYTYLVRIQNFLFHFPFDEIFLRLFFFLLDTTTSGKATDMIAGICTFPRLPCPSTKRHVMLNLTSTGAVSYTHLEPTRPY